MVALIAVLGLVLVGLVYGVLIYNGLVQLKHNVAQAWANIDVLLKQRHDELPKLVDVCKQYMQYERDVLEKVVQARTSVGAALERRDIAGLGTAETELRKGLTALFAVAENYPDLKANRSFAHLQQRISQLETQIADRREYYNDAVNANNVRVEQFPDAVIARVFDFGSHPLLTFQPGELRDVSVKELFSN